MRKLNEIGDTIVEVMLAIAVVSAVLGGAFVSSNKSLQGARQSQERGEAMKLLEGQLERMKQLSGSTGSNLFTQSAPFCVNDTPAIRLASDAACRQGTDGRYALSITRNANTFTALATWDRIGGGGQDRVQLIYRIYQN
jgi:type II secretory pathway pseudopilin PulG